MTKSIAHSPHWKTSSFGHPADVSSLERDALSEHMSLCAGLRGPLHAFQSGAATVQGVLAGRVITSVVVVVLLSVGVWLLR